MSRTPRSITPAAPRAKLAILGSAALASVLVAGSILTFSSNAYAATAPVGLRTVGSYSVLGGQTVANTGPTTLDADLGVSPGSAIVGFPPGLAGGSTHAGDAVADQAQSDLVVAYDDTASRAPTANIAGDLVGKTLNDGVYKSTGPIAVSGTLTLDGQGDKNSVFIFQVADTLITASASTVSLINGAQACNVFWQVASSATLGTNSVFIGTVMALTSISVATGAAVQGKALARNGSVTLDQNVFSSPNCDRTPTTTSSSAPAASGSDSGAAASASASAAAAKAAALAAAKAAALAAANSSSAAAAALNQGEGGSGVALNQGKGGSGVDLAATGLDPMTTRLFLVAPILLIVGGLLVLLARPTTRRSRPRHAA